MTFTENEFLIRNQFLEILNAAELRLQEKKSLRETSIEDDEFSQTSSQNLIEELQSLFK